MRETLATAPNRRTYILHARAHLERIKACFPRVQARAAAQSRGDPSEGGRTGCIKRLEEYKRLIEQYEQELVLWAEMERGENVKTLEPKPPQLPDEYYHRLATGFERGRRDPGEVE